MSPEKIKILLIEDDYFLAGIYLSKFEMEGFEVFVAKDSETGLKIAREKNPDIILLDILLPDGKDGFATLAELKSASATKNIPVIMMTNLSEEENIRKAFSLGAADYIIKSNFLPAEVIEKVKKVLMRN